MQSYPLAKNIPGNNPLFCQVAEKGLDTCQSHPDSRNLDTPVLLMLNKRLYISSRHFFKAGRSIGLYHIEKNKYGAPPAIQCLRSAVTAGHGAKVSLNMLLARQIHLGQLFQDLTKRFYTFIRM